MKRILYAIAAYVLPFMAIVSVSCTKDRMETDQETATRQITITPQFEEIETEIITKSGNTGYTLGECDIYCFVFDGNNYYSLMEGYPKKQDSMEGNSYTFTIPELENATVLFAIYPETVSFKQVNNRYNLMYYFKADDISSPSNLVYTSKTYSGNTTSENSSINLNGITLEKYNFNAKMKLDLSRLPNKDNISCIYMTLQYNDFLENMTSTTPMEYLFGPFSVSDMAKETEEDKTFYCKDLTLLCYSTNRMEFCIYMKNGDYYSSYTQANTKNMEITVTIPGLQ